MNRPYRSHAKHAEWHWQKCRHPPNDDRLPLARSDDAQQMAPGRTLMTKGSWRLEQRLAHFRDDLVMPMNAFRCSTTAGGQTSDATTLATGFPAGERFQTIRPVTLEFEPRHLSIRQSADSLPAPVARAPSTPQRRVGWVMLHESPIAGWLWRTQTTAPRQEELEAARRYVLMALPASQPIHPRQIVEQLPLAQ